MTVVTADGGNGGTFSVADSSWGVEKDFVTEYKTTYEEDALVIKGKNPRQGLPKTPISAFGSPINPN